MNLDELNDVIDEVLLSSIEPKIIEIEFSDYIDLMGQLTNEKLVSCDNIVFKFV
jgi:hypothetical protein